MTLGRFGSFALAAIAALALTLNAIVESFHSARLGLVLLILLLVHLLRYPRFLFCREFALYSIFVWYMFIALLWTADVDLAMNTVEPALTFIIILILFGSLVTYHNSRVVLAGTLVGFLLGGAFYAFTQGFPFVVPDDFSYNAIAGMYLFGLFATLAFGWRTRSAALSFSIGLIILVHIAATSSIKTNLGILLGVIGTGLIYFKYYAYWLRRYAISLVAVAGLLAFAAASNNAVMDRLEYGVSRVALGIDVLTAGSDVTGYAGFAERGEWAEEGLKGLAKNPIIGYGVEAFRDRFGITSHSTPIDLLYNFGLIGFVLFYAIFGSMAWRLFRARDTGLGSLNALMFGGLVCYLFITLSGTMHYNTFLAGFIGIGTALLNRHRGKTPGPEVASGNTIR